jgi:cell division protein FtsW
MNNFLDSVKQFFVRLFTNTENMPAGIENSFAQSNIVSGLYTLAVRWILPILAVTVFIRCILPLLQTKKHKTVRGYLSMEKGSLIPINQWENSIGRSKLCDIVISLSYISRNHAVLTYRDGTWTITDLNSKGGVEVNHKKTEGSQIVNEGDIISLAGVEMKLVLPTDEEIQAREQTASETSDSISLTFKPGLTFLLIILFQVLGGIQVCISMGPKININVPLAILFFILTEFVYFLLFKKSLNFELELLCFFLCGLNLFIVASAAPGSLIKQYVAIVTGIVAFTFLRIVLNDLGRARKFKYILSAAALALIAANLIFGEARFGAKNWINLGFITFQPFEFVKIAFVIAGAATLDKLLTTRNLTAFIAFSGVCIGALILIRDFGTAVIFFASFLVIAFMRSGDIRTIALISAGAVLGAIAVITFMPYVASRFEAWGNVWAYPDTIGYQQTRTMIAAASGGLLGVGGGNGYLVDIAAADTDLVFGVLCEEWGLITALLAVSIIVFFAVFAVISVKNCCSSFYAIAACGAAAIFLVQTALNVFGSVDILPLTGITLPFISNGGSSMIASWGLFAFIKSCR